MSALPWLLAGFPMTVGLALLAATLAGRAGRASGPLAIVTVVVSFLLSLWATAARPAGGFHWLEAMPVLLLVDGLAVAMVVTLCAICLAAVLVAGRELRIDEGRARCLGLLLILFGASLAASMAASLLVLLVAWEVMALAIWGLMGFSWREQGVGAGVQAYLFLRAGDLGLYLAAVATMVGAGTLEIALAAESLGAPWLHIAAAGLILSAAVKSAQLPFSLWLGEALGRRTQLSGALGAALMMVAGAYLLVRTYDIVAQVAWALPTVAWFGAVTALLMGLVALAQRDLLQTLAASSASQKGFMLMAVGVSTLPGAVAYLVAHTAFKALLFVGAALYLRRIGTTHLHAVGAVRAQMPRVALLFSLGALALAGVPPLPGWVVKDEVLAAARTLSPALYALGLMAAVVTALYASRMLWFVQDMKREMKMNRAPTMKSRGGTTDASSRSLGAMSLLAAMTVATSAFLLPPIRTWWQELVGEPAGPHPTSWELALTGTLAVAALLLARHWHRAGRLEPLALPGLAPRTVAWLRHWLGMRGAVRLLLASVFSMSRALVSFDNRLAATAEALGRWGRSLAGCVATQDEVSVDGLVEKLAAYVGLAGRWARRPQTGLLHQYYAQLTAVLFVLMLILWLSR